jgi:adenosine deaminase
MLTDFIRSIPKTETHLHIEGAVPLELLRKLDPARYVDVPEAWHPDYRFDTFGDFDKYLLGMVVPWFTTPERYHEAARLVFEKLQKEQNVRYVETSFASGVVEFVGIDGAAIAEAVKSAAPEGLEVRVFFGLNHDAWNERTQGFIEDCINWKHLDGIDLHGDENIPLGGWADKVWKRFNDAGKVTKAHAGEFCGAEFVREVIERLDVRRIEHGERAARNREVISMVRDRGITLDMCPISNLKLRVVPSIAEHPLHNLLARGIRCTINTDDPICFGNTLFDDYEILAHEGGCSKRDLLKAARCGFESAIVDEGKRSRWLAEIDQLEASLKRD